MAEYHKVLSLERYGIVGEILLVPAKDWTKSPVPFPAEIARTILKRNIGN